MLRALTSTTAQTGPSAISGAVLLRHAVELGLVIVIALITAQAIWFVIYGSDALDVDVNAPSRAERTAEAGALAVGDLSGVFAHVAQAAMPIAPESRLGFTLRGVRVGEAPGSGSAIIDIPNDGQRLVGTGQTLSADIRLEEVYADRVVINRRGVRESLFLTDQGRQRARSGASSNTSNAAAETAPVQMSEREMARGWLSGLSLTPVYADGAVRGLRVDGGADQLSSLGLEPGDVVLSLNATPLTSEAAAVRAFALLDAADMAVARVLRDGNEITVETSLR